MGPSRMRERTGTLGSMGPWTGIALASLGLCGCATFWDDVTSRNFSLKKWFVKQDPLVVLQNSNDGDDKARAIRALKEPAQHGGSQAEQDVVVKILTTAATSSREPLCRLAAIEKLGHFQDPRAVPALKDAYYAGARSFHPETATIIKTDALTALGRTHNPAAVDLLVTVAREPPPAATVSEDEKRQAMDVRIAAVRALGNFSHYQAAGTLVQILQSEKNVALRDCAHESLQAATGKKLPPDPKAWEEFFKKAGPNESPLVRNQGPFQSLRELLPVSFTAPAPRSSDDKTPAKRGERGE